MKTAFFIHIALAAIIFVSGCQEEVLTEKQQAIKEAQRKADKTGDDRQLKLIPEVHEILDAPPPTEDEISDLVERAISNMVRIEGGRFIMGVSPERMGGDWDGWKPVDGIRQQASIHESAFHEHWVLLDTYYLSKYETSYAEFDAWKKATGREIRFAEMSPWYKGYSLFSHECCRAPNKPAAADWYEAKAYCEWLGEQSGLPVTLPTEAQWEYAARERGKWLMYATKWGGISRETIGDGDTTYDVHGLSDSENEIGLQFLNGNLSEWVLDWYDPHFYEYSPEKNPINATPYNDDNVELSYENNNVHRGGSAFNGSFLGREYNVFNRFYNEPDYYGFGSVGIRCAVNVSEDVLK